MLEGETTKRFAQLLYDWPANEPEVLELCRWLLIDGIAVGVGGSSERGPTIAAAVARATQAAPIATVIGHGFATDVAAAARVNGMSMHVLDYEPMWDPPSHVTSTLVPAVLALAEQQEQAGAAQQGARVLRAIAKGVEAQGRIRLSSGQIEPGALKFHPPGVAGPIATAAACADLLGLDLAALSMAVGIAASRAGGVIANVGSMTKALHCGDAAAHGLEAALLAQRGFTSDPDAIGSPRGYGRAYYGDGFDPSHLVAPMGTPVAIVRRLNQDTVKLLAQEDAKQRFLSVGVEPSSNSPEEFTAMIKANMAMLGKVIKDAGIRNE